MKSIIYKAIVLLITTPLIVSSCKKDNPPAEFTGSWVETTDRTDTIVFMDDKMMDLRLGYEIRNTFVLPKIGAGLYIYDIKSDGITLQYGLSSSFDQTIYSFKKDGDKLYIGDFYQKTGSKGQVLTFERLK
ncbi:MAG: hypothetical protein ACO1N7_01085 [Sphingobacteriaceae bacterium]